MNAPAITVFTPTFDRAHTLHRPYESLARQTFRDFEWLVVDDGSSDGTSDLVEGWRGGADFAVRVLRQENRGKHIAMNRGVDAARGRFFLTLDSDDECVPEALERLRSHWDGIPVDSRERFSGVVGRCIYPGGRMVGGPFPRAVIDASPLELRYRFGVSEELWGFVRTDLLRRFRFPESPERTRIPESLVWDRIAASYLTRFVDEVFRVYHVERGPTSLGAPGDPSKGAYGSAEQHRMILNEQLAWFRCAPLAFLRSAVHYTRFSFHLGVSPRGQLRGLSAPGARLLGALALPLGAAAFLLDRRRKG